ncbi:MAG: M48 family metalloprotease [Nitrospiraceae bacterium]|nr:M48 family metalloprotease [Nitrospiraceae bacterium]
MILLLCLACAGCATTDLPPVTQDFRFEEDERRLWLRSVEEQRVIDKSGLIYRDEELDVYLNEIAKRLQSPDIFTHIPFKIKVIKNHLLNAFAFPNGVIYIHTGILVRMENEAQLATLLAHEMTHSTHRHLVKQFRNIKNLTAFVATMQVTLGGLGAGDIATLLGMVGTLAATGYSREHETEADMEGLKLMAKARYDPQEAPKLFMHLKRELEDENIKEPFFFGTHPRLQERIENYEDFLKTQYHEKRGGIKNQEVFLEKIHKVILDNAYLDLKAGRFKIAQKSSEKYLALKPDDAKAYCLLGEIFRQKAEQGDTERAKEYYQKAISIDPMYPEPYKGIGMIYYKQGEKSLAKKYLESYLSLLPKALDRAYIEEYIRHCNEEGK